jgi:hypothetical protein
MRGMCKFFWGILGLCVLCAGQPLMASAWEWQSLEKHPFRVYHKASQQVRARQVLDALVETAPPVLDYFNETVSGPDVYGVLPDLSGRPWVDVVLDDEGLIANGYVNISSGKILFLQALPDTRRFLQIGSYWQHLVAHELTHYAHLEMSRPLGDPLSLALGSVFTLNRSLPLFLVEGTAVWWESRNGEYGRLHDGYTAAVAHAQSETPEAMDPVSLRYPYYQFPYGDAPYFYGGMLTQFLVRASSDVALRDLYATHVRHPVGALMGHVMPSFGIDAAARHVYGKTVPDLFADWQTEVAQQKLAPSWTQHTVSAGYKSHVSLHRGELYYVQKTYRHPEPFVSMLPRYDVIRWSADAGERVVYRSQRPIVGLQFSGTSMLVLTEEWTPEFENHVHQGYGRSRVLEDISLRSGESRHVASGAIVGFTIKEGQVFYVTPAADGVGSVLWGILNGRAERLGELPVYVAEMVPFQRQLAVVAKTPGLSWQLLTLDPVTLRLTPLVRTKMALARVWGDGEDLYMSVNAPLGYQMYRFRGHIGVLEQLTTANHATYGVPVDNRLFVVSVTSKGEELFSLPLLPRAAAPLAQVPVQSTIEKTQGLPRFDALGTNLDSLLPHRMSAQPSLGVFGEDRLALFSYHLGYSDGVDLGVTARILSPLVIQGRFAKAGNALQGSWPLFRSWSPGLKSATAELAYRWEKWVPAVSSVWQWWDSTLSQTVGVGLDEGYMLRFGVSQVIGDGELSLLVERDDAMDREDRQRGKAGEHLEDVTGERVEMSLTHRLFPIRKGLWSPNVFFGDLFAEIYVGHQTFGDSGTYYGAELQLEGHAAGGLRLLPYLGVAQYPEDAGVYGGVTIRLE